jgi:hypothetical protein
LDGREVGMVDQEQRRVCERFGVVFVPSPPHLKVGIAEDARSRLRPLNGLRHVPEGDTTGWYIWAGESLSRDADYFQPLHVAHLDERCPAVIPYLGLPPGWRFLLAENYEDVWFDPDLLGGSAATR